MGALLSLLRCPSDYKPSATKKGHRASAPTMMTRANIAMANRRFSNNTGADSNNYDDGNSGGSGGGGGGAGGDASARELVFPDSFEVLPQPHDPRHYIYMAGVHEQQRKFRCRFCGKGYRWKSTMRRHESVECGGKPPSFQCSECPYKARQRGNLTVHFKRHHQKTYDESV